ncbi:PrsW family intramembrane metalloprotease [Lacisediminihabitans changchengi]|uniref:PrsW family intramembrane metalloprotease n=1 Tax=Lacisediminihabitans changchengi TaxID=2787634 RepID=A0A934VY27_9MICO|nr:PrsW family intramembrane metalloprotease [Lacisediminihabitans changchengi]MBK4347567.1 PrsW family intramembrane metalloprotease [Lacisediminihabitans changchengi]
MTGQFSAGQSRTVQQVAAATEPVAEDPRQVLVTSPPRRGGLTIALTVIGFVLLSAILVVVVLYLFLVLGPTALLYAAILAAVPLAAVLLGIRWIDRWEPEPRGALLFAFLWGAAASVFIALVFSGLTQAYEAQHGLSGSPAADLFETVVQAPIVEEFAKGFGVLLLLWVMRSTFDGPVDGIVYAATVAIGFAFTENLQYFGLALLDDNGIGAVGAVFLLRAVLSPFAHVMFTACTGLLLGLAARHTGRIGAIGFFVLGLIPAVLLHAFWNSAGYWADNWFGYYFTVQVPLFILAIVGVALLRRHEQRITRERLAEYAAVGWFTPSEVNQLSTGAGRRQAVWWARRHGLRRQYRRFVTDATRLAFTRQRLISGKDRIRTGHDEAALLERIVADRRALAALPPLLVLVPRTA